MITPHGPGFETGEKIPGVTEELEEDEAERPCRIMLHRRSGTLESIKARVAKDLNRRNDLAKLMTNQVSSQRPLAQPRTE